MVDSGLEGEGNQDREDNRDTTPEEGNSDILVVVVPDRIHKAVENQDHRNMVHHTVEQ